MIDRHPAVGPERQFYEALGERLKAARNAQGITQQRLAELVGLPRTSLLLVERGKQAVRVHTLVLFAEALHTPIADLLPGRDQPPEEEFDLGASLPDGIRAWVVTTQALAVGQPQTGGEPLANKETSADRAGSHGPSRPARRSEAARAGRGNR